jgi:hypothetical protein
MKAEVKELLFRLWGVLGSTDMLAPIEAALIPTRRGDSSSVLILQVQVREWVRW